MVVSVVTAPSRVAGGAAVVLSSHTSRVAGSDSAMVLMIWASASAEGRMPEGRLWRVDL